jgi:hypothetical protein
MKYPTFASWIQNRRRKRKQHPVRKPAKQKAIGWLEAVIDKEESKISQNLLAFCSGWRAERIRPANPFGYK